MLPGMHFASPDPWDALAALGRGVRFQIDRLPKRTLGRTVWPADGSPPTITLALGAGAIPLTCGLAHELLHLRDGPPPAGRPSARDERAIREATARWLLPDLGAVMRELRGAPLWDAGERLGVIYPVLMDRLTTLNDAEAHAMRRFRDRDAAA